MQINNQKVKSFIKIVGVFLCLYFFLVGIKGLSGSIKKITQPNEIKVGDMIQTKIKLQSDKKQKTFVSVVNVVGDKAEEYEDSNSNKKYDEGESFKDSNNNGVWDDIKYECEFGAPEEYEDSNSNKKYDEGESFKDSNNNGVWDDTKKYTIKDQDVKLVASSSFVTATESMIISLFIGIFATVLFQSSSTTTSLIVGMVSTTIVPLSSGIAMIMGANIGTTVTNTIVSIGHLRRGNEFKRAFAASTVHDFFNILAVIIIFPIEMLFHPLERLARFLGDALFTKIDDKPFESPIKDAVSWGIDYFKELSFGNNWVLLITSILLTFLMLYFIVKILRSLVLKNVEAFFGKYIFKTPIRAILFGIVLTIAVQSSSITTSTIVPLAAAGVLSLRQVFPYTLGANIGTTATAMMAALTLNPIALVAAFSHLLFNIAGILIIYPIKFLRNIPLKLAEKMADAASKNKMIPIIYLLIVFFLIPFTIIMLGG